MIVAGMSGGVDSSVAALLLKRRGETVQGVYMHNWDSSDPGCRGEADRMDALRVCAALDIPFAVRDFSVTYREQVFAQFLSDYAQGLTPNPDVLCNREVKFKVFLDEALNMGASGLATGHYARKATVNGQALLLRGRDPGKDQSYFLHQITQDALRLAEFPLGDIPKSEVRRLAQDAGLLTASKKDSTGICFIGEQDFKTFLSQYLPARPGEVVDEQGRVIGRHNGAMYYTLGQRAPVGGVKGAGDTPWFILAKQVHANRLVAGQGHDHPKLMSIALATQKMSWIAGHPPAASFDGEVQIRHLGAPEPARITVQEDGGIVARFTQSVRGVAPGQSAAVYQGEVCLGGAPIV